jgi:hypothetical protein
VRGHYTAGIDLPGRRSGLSALPVGVGFDVYDRAHCLMFDIVFYEFPASKFAVKTIDRRMPDTHTYAL